MSKELGDKNEEDLLEELAGLTDEVDSWCRTTGAQQEADRIISMGGSAEEAAAVLREAESCGNQAHSSFKSFVSEDLAECDDAGRRREGSKGSMFSGVDSFVRGATKKNDDRVVATRNLLQLMNSSVRLMGAAVMFAAVITLLAMASTRSADGESVSSSGTLGSDVVRRPGRMGKTDLPTKTSIGAPAPATFVPEQATALRPTGGRDCFRVAQSASVPWLSAGRPELMEGEEGPGPCMKFARDSRGYLVDTASQQCLEYVHSYDSEAKESWRLQECQHVSDGMAFKRSGEVYSLVQRGHGGQGTLVQFLEEEFKHHNTFRLFEMGGTNCIQESTGIHELLDHPGMQGLRLGANSDMSACALFFHNGGGNLEHASGNDWGNPMCIVKKLTHGAFLFKPCSDADTFGRKSVKLGGRVVTFAGHQHGVELSTQPSQLEDTDWSIFDEEGIGWDVHELPEHEHHLDESEHPDEDYHDEDGEQGESGANDEDVSGKRKEEEGKLAGKASAVAEEREDGAEAGGKSKEEINSQNCWKWSVEGECAKNYVWMQENCKDACGQKMGSWTPKEMEQVMSSEDAMMSALGEGQKALFNAQRLSLQKDLNDVPEESIRSLQALESQAQRVAAQDATDAANAQKRTEELMQKAQGLDKADPELQAMKEELKKEHGELEKRFDQNSKLQKDLVAMELSIVKGHGLGNLAKVASGGGLSASGGLGGLNAVPSSAKADEMPPLDAEKPTLSEDEMSKRAREIEERKAAKDKKMKAQKDRMEKKAQEYKRMKEEQEAQLAKEQEEELRQQKVNEARSNKAKDITQMLVDQKIAEEEQREQEALLQLQALRDKFSQEEQDLASRHAETEARNKEILARLEALEEKKKNIAQRKKDAKSQSKKLKVLSDQLQTEDEKVKAAEEEQKKLVDFEELAKRNTERSAQLLERMRILDERKAAIEADKKHEQEIQDMAATIMEEDKHLTQEEAIKLARQRYQERVDAEEAALDAKREAELRASEEKELKEERERWQVHQSPAKPEAVASSILGGFSNLYGAPAPAPIVNTGRQKRPPSTGHSPAPAVSDDSEEAVASDCDESMSGNGHDYRGCQTRSKSGRLCQKWTQHTQNAFEKPEGGLGNHNFCRNPDNRPRIWCYTKDHTVRKEVCDPIPKDSRLEAGAAVVDQGVAALQDALELATPDAEVEAEESPEEMDDEEEMPTQKPKAKKLIPGSWEYLAAKAANPDDFGEEAEPYESAIGKEAPAWGSPRSFAPSSGPPASESDFVPYGAPSGAPPAGPPAGKSLLGGFGAFGSAPGSAPASTLKSSHGKAPGSKKLMSGFGSAPGMPPASAPMMDDFDVESGSGFGSAPGIAPAPGAPGPYLTEPGMAPGTIPVMKGFGRSPGATPTASRLKSGGAGAQQAKKELLGGFR